MQLMRHAAVLALWCACAHGALAQALWWSQADGARRLDSQTPSRIEPVNAVPGAMVVDPLAVWQAGDTTLLRIALDGAPLASATLPGDAGLPARLASDGAGGLWVARDRLLLHYDAALDMRIVATLPAPVDALADGGPTFLWVATFGLVVRFDAHGRAYERHVVDATGQDPVRTLALDAAAGTLWVLTSGAALALDVHEALRERGRIAVSPGTVLALDRSTGAAWLVSPGGLAGYDADGAQLAAWPMPGSVVEGLNAATIDPGGARRAFASDARGILAMELDTGRWERVGAPAAAWLADHATWVTPDVEMITQREELAVILDIAPRCRPVSCVDGGAYGAHSHVRAWLDDADVSARASYDSTGRWRLGLDAREARDATMLSVTALDAFGNASGERRFDLQRLRAGATAKTNQPPVVTITAPANNATSVAPATFNISATASDPDGTVTKVEFYRNGTLLGTDATAPYSFAWSNVAVGAYALTAKAYDNAGAITTSATVNVQVKANVAPTVTLTSPPNNANFVAPATITLSATAADSDGTVAKVDFLRGGATLVGTVTTPPFTYTWTNVAAGTYSLTAKATDDKGAATTSTAVTAKVNNPPSVTLTAPANNAVVIAPATVTLQASASDTDGTVSKVEFFQNGSLLGADTTSPYSYAWANPPLGSYSLTAKATDNLGATRVSAPVAISVKANQAPVVTLTSPTASLQRVAGTTLPVTATASDPDGSIVKVEFSLGGVLMSTDTTAPYAGTVTVLQGALPLTATAYDNKGAQTVSAPVTITGVANQLPSVTLDAPVNSEVIASQTPPDIVLKATALDLDGTIVRVRFMAITHLNDGTSTAPVLVGTATQAPYTVTWQAVPFSIDGRNSSQIGPDEYEVWAEADDDAGATTVSLGAYIRVLNWSPWSMYVPNVSSGMELAPPATLVVVGVPANYFLWNGDPIARVDLVADGATIASLTTPNGSLGEYVFTWRNVPPGTHNLALVLTDAGGFVVVQPVDPISIKVRAVDQPPTVRLTAPSGERLLLPGVPSVTLSATASDGDGTVTAVDFMADGEVLARTTAPFTTTWTNIPVGIHAVSARARDDRGQVAESAPAIVNVMVADRLPVVVLTAPAPGANYQQGAPITFSADALAPDGTIRRVDFVDDVTGLVLGSVTSAPYKLNLLVGAGAPTLRAIAVSNTGRTGSSTPVHITVSRNAAPAVTLTAPVDGQVGTVGAPVTLSATASDSDGTVASVAFLVNGAVVATDASAPYSASWVPATSGTYSITARATDNAGAVTTSSTATITIVTASSVTVLSPAPNSTSAVSQPLAISASASMPGRTIARVDFLADGAVIGSVPFAAGGSAAVATYTWSSPPAGPHSLVARSVATDGTTLSSSAVAVRVSDFTVTLSEPYAGQTYVAPGDIRITAAPQAVGSTIARVDFLGDGVVIATAAAPPYTTVGRNMGTGGHTVAVRAVDSAGLTVGAAATVQVVAAPGIALDAGIDGASIADDAASITGTIQAPRHASLIINGHLAALDPLGRFFLDNLLLQPGINQILLSLNTHDGPPVQQTLTLNSTGSGTFAVDLSPQQGFAPLATTLAIRNRTGTSYSRVEVDSNDDGTPEQTLAIAAGGELRLAFSFPSPGVYRMRVTVYDASNKVVYQARRQVRVYDRAELAGNVVGVYWSMLDRLGANDAAAALHLFTADAQDRYADVFATLGSGIVAVAPQLRRIVDGVVGEDIAELTHLRDTPNGPALFMIYLVRGRDGLWRIETM